MDDVGQVGALLFREPHRQASVLLADVYGGVGQVGLHLVGYLALVVAQGLLGVVGQLHQQQGVDAVFLPGGGQLVALAQGTLQQALVHRQGVLLGVAPHAGVQLHAFLYHLLCYHVLAAHHNVVVAPRRGGGADAQLYLGFDHLAQQAFALLGIAAGEHMLLVDDSHHGPLLARALQQGAEGAVLLVVADQQVVVLVDALPVQEEHLAGAQAFADLGFVEPDGAQRARLAEEVAHRAVALLVQLVGRQPHPRHAAVVAVGGSRCQFSCQLIHSRAGHHRLAAARGSLQHQSLTLLVVAQHLHQPPLQLVHGVALVGLQFYHSFSSFHSSYSSIHSCSLLCSNALSGRHSSYCWA